MHNNIIINKNQVFRGMSIEVYPSEEQKIYINKCINCCRFIYNWTLEQEENNYKQYLLGQSEKSFISKNDIYKKFSEFRNNTEWLKEVPYRILRYSIDNAIRAYKNFFLTKNRFNKPKFKSKKSAKKSIQFKTEKLYFYFENDKIKLEGMPGKFIKSRWKSGFTRETTPKIYKATITVTKSGKYHFSFCTIRNKKNDNYFIEKNIPESEVLGIDLNVKKRFALSNGQSFIGPDLSKQNKRINYLQTKVSKDISRLKEMERTNPNESPKKSNRMLKRQYLLAKTYEKKHNKIESFIQETTKHIIDMHPKAIVMEDLGTKEMLSKHYMAKQMHDACFYRCREVMQYKCEEYNIPFILAPKDYPSSQICSCCGEQKDIKIINYRTFVCCKCGNRMDRDLNAAINLSHLAIV